MSTKEKDPSPTGLPLPRLQITWERKDKPDKFGHRWRCRYELLIPVPTHDIRNKRKRGYIAATLGGTSIGREHDPLHWGELETPFRDGAHIKWDAATLALPAFVVWKDHYRRLDSPQRQWPPVDTARAASKSGSAL